MLRSIPRHLVICLTLARLVAAGEHVGVWLDVPFVKQEKNACGPACISMVMQYWIKQGMGAQGDAADTARIQQALWPLEAGGIPASEMARYFRMHGYRTFVFNGEWADLEKHLAKGRPLILALKATDRGTRFHYVVVAGLDGRRGLVLVNDPARRKLLKLDRTSFEKAWKATDHWTLLALPQPGR